MILDLKIPSERIKAETYLKKLITDQCKVDLKKVPEKRTIKQNRYLHALFTLYGGEVGLTTDEAKIVIKRELGYVYEKNGTAFLKHTSKMDSKELTILIDRFRNLSSSQGIYLLSPEEFSENYGEMMKQVTLIESQMRQYSY